MFIVVHVHLLAGDILSAIDALCLICEKTSLLKKSSRVEANSSRGSPASTSLSNSRHSTSSPARTPERSLCPHTSPKRSVAYGSNISSPRSTAEPNRNTLQHLPTASRSPMDDHENGNDMSAPSSPIVPQKSMIETFDDLLDRAWNLVRIHPFREVQTIVLIRMLCSHFPIYHRLAADPRLCRLVDPHIELVSSSIHSSDSLSSRRLMDLTVRERHAALKTARLPSEARVKAIRQKSDQCAAIDRLRFYNECGHYEKCVVETGPGKLEFAALRNKLRKCTKCVTRNKVA
uniref:Uncharacterized protein n=1 Tax=Acrobeloides nanus TaxID=290746 RepID=A0A914CU96_9BILA